MDFCRTFEKLQTFARTHYLLHHFLEVRKKLCNVLHQIRNAASCPAPAAQPAAQPAVQAKTSHPIGVRLQKAQRYSLEHLWKRCCMPDGDPNREGLPGRCDKPWFSKVFLAGQGLDRTGEDSIWDLTGTFQAYDPVALLAALPGIRDRFLAPHTVARFGGE